MEGRRSDARRARSATRSTTAWLEGDRLWTNANENKASLAIGAAAGFFSPSGLQATTTMDTAPDASTHSAYLHLSPLRDAWRAGAPGRVTIRLQFAMRVVGDFHNSAGPRFTMTDQGGANFGSIGFFVNLGGGLSLEQLEPMCVAAGTCYQMAADALASSSAADLRAWHTFELTIDTQDASSMNGVAKVSMDGTQLGSPRPLRVVVANRANIELHFGMNDSVLASGTTVTMQFDNLVLETSGN